MERLIKHVAEKIQLDTSKWVHDIQVSSWKPRHMITEQMQKDV